MKLPRPKTHIVESHEPLSEGVELVTLCGAKLARPKFVAMAETDYLPGSTVEATQPKGICPKCLNVLESLESLSVRTLRYLAVEAQEFQNLDVVGGK